MAWVCIKREALNRVMVGRKLGDDGNLARRRQYQLMHGDKEGDGGGVFETASLPAPSVHSSRIPRKTIFLMAEKTLADDY